MSVSEVCFSTGVECKGKGRPGRVRRMVIIGSPPWGPPAAGKETAAGSHPPVVPDWHPLPLLQSSAR